MELEEAIELLESEGYQILEEDFTQGVGAPLGADQGIPHSMQGCAVPMMRLGDPAPRGRIQRMPGPPPPHRRFRPIPFMPVIGVIPMATTTKKKKKKKRKKKK